MKIKYYIIDSVENEKQVENIKHCLADEEVMVISNIEDYLNDDHMQTAKSIEAFQGLYYDEYINKSETLFVITNLSKKLWRKFKNEVVNSQFYPLNMIRIMSSDSVEKIISKIKLHSNEDMFREKYDDLALGSTENIPWQLFNTITFNNITSHIMVCPYCRGDDFRIINDVEEFEKDGHCINYSGVFGCFGEHLKCNNCNKTISSREIMRICH
jgi:hypothetical protein